MSNTKEQNKIGVSEFEMAVRSVQNDYAEVEWNGLNIHIEHALSLERMIQYMDYVTSACFDSNTGEYLPEVKDFAIRSGMIEFFTNIVMPTDVNKKYALMYGTDIINVIMSYVDAVQMNSFLISVDKKLDYLADANIERIRKQFENVAKSFEELSSNMAQAFSGVSGEDISKISNAIANGAFDESKLVQLFTEQTLMSNGKDSNSAATTKE